MKSMINYLRTPTVIITGYRLALILYSQAFFYVDGTLTWDESGRVEEYFRTL